MYSTGPAIVQADQFPSDQQQQMQIQLNNSQINQNNNPYQIQSLGSIN